MGWFRLKKLEFGDLIAADNLQRSCMFSSENEVLTRKTRSVFRVWFLWKNRFEKCYAFSSLTMQFVRQKGKYEMIYKYNETLSAKALSDLRESVGWNRMEKEYENPLMTSYYHIAVYDKDELIGYIDCVSNGVTDDYVSERKTDLHGLRCFRRKFKAVL